jgi:hypothetical protein
VAIYTGAKALSRWPINDESTLTRIKADNSRHCSPAPNTLVRHLDQNATPRRFVVKVQTNAPSSRISVALYLAPSGTPLPQRSAWRPSDWIRHCWITKLLIYHEGALAGMFVARFNWKNWVEIGSHVPYLRCLLSTFIYSRYHPLAITQTGSYIKKPQCLFGTLMDEFNNCTKEILQSTPELYISWTTPEFLKSLTPQYTNSPIREVTIVATNHCRQFQICCH